MLAIGAGLSESNFARLEREGLTVDVDGLAVGLHVHLLDVRRELDQGL